MILTLQNNHQLLSCRSAQDHIHRLRGKDTEKLIHTFHLCKEMEKKNPHKAIKSYVFKS